jgi:predicted nucleic acid-binding protein
MQDLGNMESRFNYGSCFVIARLAGVKEAFAFDQHFNTMEFILRP